MSVLRPCEECGETVHPMWLNCMSCGAVVCELDEKRIRYELLKVVRNDNHDGKGFFRYSNPRTKASEELIARGWAKPMGIGNHLGFRTELVESTVLGRCIAELHRAWA